MNFNVSDEKSRRELINSLRDKIDNYCKTQYNDGFRKHMGASKIGDLCNRKIWSDFRWIKAPEFSGRIARIFNRGHLEEDRFFEWLRGAGVKVSSHDANGKQFRISDCDGHFGGSCDGIIEIPGCKGMQFLLELKTSKDGPDFKILFENGVAKAKPVHYAQMCVYGYKLFLTHALYMCINKNNDDIYMEVVELDFERAKQLIAKASDLIFNPEPPPKISNHPTYHVCKMCEYYNICHMDEKISTRNCRSCKQSRPDIDKAWICGKWNCAIPEDGIYQGCDSWESIL